MIPRLKPYVGFGEIAAALDPNTDSVKQFEKAFARKFKAKYAVSFMYGRSGLYALFKCLNIKNAEIIMPAYTCVVVAHAIVKSGNIPRFVDIEPKTFNMNLSQVKKAINSKTRAIIGTSLFGYPFNNNRLKKIIKKSGKKILLIQDCAHSFGAEYKGELLCNQGDAAIFGLNISKQITSIFGGMITTNNKLIYQKLIRYRGENFKPASITKIIKNFVYLTTVEIAFIKFIYNIVNYLERRTNFTDRFTKYYRSNKIDMPNDWLVKLPPINAQVGLVQLKKYDKIKKDRYEIAQYYHSKLSGLKNIYLPPIIGGATYSHYVLRVKNKEDILLKALKKGIQLGWLIEYSIPDMAVYKKYAHGLFPVSKKCAKTTINLPNYPTLSKKHQQKIINFIKEIDINI